MRLVSAIVVFGLAVATVAAVTHPTRVFALYEELYPADPARRQALEMCFMRDHKFNRLDTAERDACYKLQLAPPPPVAIPAGLAPPPSAGANFVDLWRAAGQGRLPANDVRAHERNDRYFHPSGPGR